MKVISPLLGFNNNVKHKGRVYHVQTEDSGIRHPHVITHLFADGGRILKSMKTSYAEHLNEDNLRDVVHQLMKEQHQAMFVALRDGQFDHFFEEKDAAAAAAKAAAKEAAKEAKEAQAAAAAQSPISVAGPVSAAVPPSSMAMPPVSVVSPVSMVAPPVASGLRPTAPDALSAAQTSGMALDFRGLGDAAVATVAAAVELQVPQDLSPPPSAVKQGGALFTAGVYRTLATASASPAGGSAGTGRYAQARAPAIFSSAKPTLNVSIFGEDLISEKSLDEVILSYLAEDLENE